MSPNPPSTQTSSAKLLTYRTSTLARIERILQQDPEITRADYSWLIDPSVTLPPTFTALISYAHELFTICDAVDSMIPKFKKKWFRERIAIPEICPKTNVLRARHWTTPFVEESCVECRVARCEEVRYDVEERCSICLSPYNRRDPKVQTACGHVFGSACIQVWAKHNTRCPECRRERFTTANYLPAACRPSFRELQRAVDDFRAWKEDVEGWLLIGYTEHEDLTKEVENLGYCFETARRALRDVRDEAGKCRPNFALMQLWKDCEDVSLAW
ncbi:hypothetical protein FB567DRAFT_595478 [Paraphoma chrysanthemicola]|uniref:RING-type domain-containing protein n=1 Tax=Paraphoma chrysanthemicola TaxID=798071 RepID=A0A8K0R1F3_9PLEO|nr:hypothetical protein FB567DRAFT_595478 [Paraphoma chrysanthemicola]